MEKIIRQGPISVEEAIAAMQKDEMDSMVAYGAFLGGGPLPFKSPLKCERDIIVWMPSDINPAAQIGDGVQIGRYTNICGDVKIGKKCSIQGFCFIPSYVDIGERVFIGPGVIFTNEKYPQCRDDRWRPSGVRTVIEDGASLGAGCIICPGVRVGKRSLIGAGAVVTKDIPADSVFMGIPARFYK